MAEQPTDPRVGRVVGGRYVLGARMASGGQGAVYAGVQRDLERDVVIKVLHGDGSLDAVARDRFEREARLAAQLAHPNVVAIYDFGREDDGLYWIAMERLHGRTLAETVRLDGCLPWPTAVEIARQMFLALAAAHARGIVHRDIKPANVFVLDEDLSARPIVKLLDFGLARHDNDRARSQSGLVGTEAYLTPEQLENQRADARSDVFSAGVVFYELVHGENPFARARSIDTQHAILNDDPPPSGENDDVDALLRRLLKKDPAQRPTSTEALEVLDALALACAIPARGPAPTKKVTPASSSLRRPEGWRWRIAVTAAVAVALSLVALRWPEPATLVELPKTPTPAVEAFAPLPRRPAPTPIVELGRRLFVDPDLSAPRQLHQPSCATCHPLESGGTTREARTQLGSNGKRPAYNTPTIFNAPSHYRQRWGGDFETIEGVIKAPLKGPTLMGNSDERDAANRVLPVYGADLASAGLSRDIEGIKQALAAYIRWLEPRDAPFDRSLRPGGAPLDERASQGRATFESLGCVGCHQGRGVGGNLQQRLGIMVDDAYADRGFCDGDRDRVCRFDDACGAEGRCVDRGKTQPSEAEQGPFRVPSLRNVAKTAPYFHDGSVADLDDAVRVMGRLQLGRELDQADVDRLVAFLESLSGELPDGEEAELVRLQRKQAGL